MTAALAWARVDVRRRWGSLVVLAVLVAVASGAVLAAATAAHRGATALDRLDAYARPATVQVPNYDARVDLGRLASLPYVDAVGREASGGIGLLDDGRGGSTEQLTPVDGVLLDEIERPAVMEGRLFDADAPDEAVVTPQWLATFDKEVGDTATVRLPTAHQQATGTEDVPHGPEVVLRIVGVVKTPAYLDRPGSPGWFIPSPGLATTYRPNWDTSLTAPGCACQWASVGALVRLDGGAADIERLRADLARIFPHHTFNLVNLEQRRDTEQHDVLIQSWWLAAFAAAALIASLVLVGQAVARHVAIVRDQLRASRAVGYTTGQLVGAATAGPVLAAVVGAAAGVGLAVVSSHWTPLGLARAAEPDPGVTLDAPVVLVGALATVGFAAAVAALAAYRSVRAAEPRSVVRRSPIAVWAARVGLPLPVQVGARFALEPGRAGRSVPVVVTIAAVVVAVGGATGALVINGGVQDALTHPERFGQTFQSASFVGFGSTDFFRQAQIERALEPIDYVTGFALPRQSAASADGDRVGVPLFSHTATARPLPTVVLDGRMPESADEVALAPGTERALGLGPGDTVALDGNHGTADMRIVGTVLMPSSDTNRYDQGGWVTDAGYDRLFDGFDAHWVLVATDPSAGSGAAVRERLTEDVAPSMREGWAGSAAFDTMGTTRLTTDPLRQVRWFPAALALLVGLLAVAAVGHAGAVAVRRRSGDLANLRALGMTRAGTSLVMVAQGCIVATVGLLVGLPLGAALGRTVWRIIATGLPLQLVPPALGGLWVVVPAVLVIAVLLALLPASRAARLPVAALLRAE